MKRRPVHHPLVSEINITPFTDVILVLLVIFMIATPLLSQSALDVDLPHADNAKPLDSKKTNVAITITKAGLVYLEGKPVVLDDLKGKIQTIQKNNRQVGVTLNIDENTEFKSVVSVLDTLKGVGVKDFAISALQPNGARG